MCFLITEKTLVLNNFVTDLTWVFHGVFLSNLNINFTFSLEKIIMLKKVSIFQNFLTIIYVNLAEENKNYNKNNFDTK